jgi:hypothetical protein
MFIADLPSSGKGELTWCDPLVSNDFDWVSRVFVLLFGIEFDCSWIEMKSDPYGVSAKPARIGLRSTLHDRIC